MIKVDSDIGRLRRVLVHRPGLEIDWMVPRMMEQLLFDDILYGEQARREHGRFCRVMQSAGVEVLDAGYEVTGEDLDAAQDAAGVVVSSDDAVLIRTGWATHWSVPEMFLGQAKGAPGPGVSAAQWLIDRDVRVAGAETIAFEVIKPGEGHATLPVHRMLLVEAGIHIIEAMNLTALAAASVYEFLFIAAPLKIAGGTGSPMRPLAVIDG